MNKNDPSRAPLQLPRRLVVLSCLWIAGGWVLLIGVRPPMQPVVQSYIEPIQLMLQTMLLGIAVGWPLFRMTGARFTRPIAQITLDFIVLVCAGQLVVWPIRLLAGWPMMQTVALSATIVAWTLFFGALVFTAVRNESVWRRCLMMSIALLFVAGGALSDAAGTDHWWSPLGSVALAAAPTQQPMATIEHALAIAIAGIVLGATFLPMTLATRTSTE